MLLPLDMQALQRSADNAMTGARRAESLTQRLLAFSRQQPLDPKPLDIGRLVTGMSDMLRRTLGEQITVETILGGGLWRAHADPNQLELAIINLAVNARDAMPNGGRLTLETANVHLDERYAIGQIEVVPGQYVMLAITDNGSGMTPEVKAKAFDPFFTTKDVGHGTGLGLSQVYGFVKQSRGHVKIYSEVGEGTTIKLYLPRAHSAADVEDEEAAAQPLPRGSKEKPYWWSKTMPTFATTPATLCGSSAMSFSRPKTAAPGFICLRQIRTSEVAIYRHRPAGRHERAPACR